MHLHLDFGTWNQGIPSNGYWEWESMTTTGVPYFQTKLIKTHLAQFLHHEHGTEVGGHHWFYMWTRFLLLKWTFLLRSSNPRPPRLSIRAIGNTPLASCSTFSLNLLLIQRKAQWRIKGPDNPTSQLLPKMSTNFCCSGTGKEGKTKEVVEDREVKKSCVWQNCMWKMVCDKERWCVWQNCVWKMVWWKMVCDKVVRERWCVKDGVWKMACDKVVCQRWCVTKLCVKDGVWKMVWWKMVCDKVVCERWSGERCCVTKLCVKDGVVKDGVWHKVVCERWCGERWCVTKWCVKDGLWRCVKDGVWKMVCGKVVWKMVCDKVVCERWCVKDGVVKDGVWQSGVWKMVC